jgi:ribosomal protein S18 acetylase RimI-like enzyme
MDISLRPATQEDYEFLWWLHCNTIRPYVEQTWGWDEAWQLQYFQERFNLGKREIIEAGGVPIGCISVECHEDHIFLALIEIASDYQGQGIGTELIQDLLDEADGRGVPIELRVLRVNPARRLYERLGFAVVQETDTRYIMRRAPFDGTGGESNCPS